MGKRRRLAKGAGTVVRKGKVWAVRWVEGDRRRYEGGFLRQEDAESVRATIAYNIQQGRPGMPEREAAAPTSRFDDLVDAWQAARKADGHRSWKDDESRWNVHLQPLLGHRVPATVDAALLEELVADCRRHGLAGPTTTRVLHLLSSFFRWAVVQKHADTNPVRAFMAGLSRKQREGLRSKHRAEDTAFLPTKTAVAAVFKVMNAADLERPGEKPPRAEAVAYALSALAGLRPGETVALRWDDVDLKRGRITIRQQVRNGVLSVPKSGRPRVVPVVPGLLKVLKARRALDPTGLLVAPPLRTGGRRRFLGQQTIKAALDSALKEAGQPALSFYQAGRHTFASHWVLAGLDIYQLSKIMGHSSVVVTQRYAHLRDELAPEVAAAADVSLTS